jgi:tripartite-type tricarboxylate transporter receptor subunit TctC
MKKLLVAVAALALVAGLPSAGAQVYPAHPLTMVVPFAAGGPNDGIEALAAPAVRARLGDLAQEIFPRARQTPNALAALQKSEIAK